MATGVQHAAQPRSSRGYGSLSESAVEPEPASESDDDTNEVVTLTTASGTGRQPHAAQIVCRREALRLPEYHSTPLRSTCHPASFLRRCPDRLAALSLIVSRISMQAMHVPNKAPCSVHAWPA
jgi:hypothetical protein